MKRITLALLAMACLSNAWADGARAARQAEIDFYLSQYEGSDVGLEKFHCARPVFPELSRTKAEIEKVGQSVDAWLACYNRFVQGLNDSLPVGKGIPAELQALMTPAELAQAKQRMGRVYQVVSEEGEEALKAVLAASASWKEKTDAYVNAEAAKLSTVKNHQDTAERMRILKGKQ
ncbi:hypothetical protein [Massilia sp. BJB1822]|uniref:hypothetical protein n=1 Tax=Massilia sp. BJB1822 TaxID=2744470 RepID=UPI001594373F|nr:hypothetical protein [Massilia sp. BJB1822]NVD98500.1 hypothetical protein [Massilia sp. BJB1822]